MLLSIGHPEIEALVSYPLLLFRIHGIVKTELRRTGCHLCITRRTVDLGESEELESQDDTIERRADLHVTHVWDWLHLPEKGSGRVLLGRWDLAGQTGGQECQRQQPVCPLHGRAAFHQ
jgi:hypothetical protein